MHLAYLEGTPVISLDGVNFVLVAWPVDDDDESML
jgi:hypothetical protein